MNSMRTLSRPGLILFSLLALVAAGTHTVVADGPESASTALGRTEISGTLPDPETQGAAVIEWGGGSLYQLTTRLAVNGCDLNLLWVYDDQAQRYTAPYTFDGPSFLNAPFNRLYGDNIPPTTLWVQCIDMIEHVYGYGLLTDEQQAWADAQPRGVPYDISQIQDPITEDCGDHWRQGVRELILPHMPLVPGICVFLFEEVGLGGDRSGAAYFRPSFEVRGGYALHARRGDIIIPSDVDTTSRRYEFLLSAEAHELCHAHQEWYIAKNVFRYESFKGESKLKSGSTFLYYLSNSDYMNDFIGAVGLEKQESGGWVLQEGSAHSSLHTYFISDPSELSAELCSGFIMKTLGKTKPGEIHHSYEQYLTDEVIDWLEQYVFVLPESRLAR